MSEAEVKQGFLERNKKTIMVVGIIVVAALLFLPDVYIRKIPWVK